MTRDFWGWREFWSILRNKHASKPRDDYLWSDAEILFCDGIGQILHKYNDRIWGGIQIYINPRLPIAKMRGAYKNIPLLPANENILGLIDLTFSGSANDCIIFTNKGVHQHYSDNTPEYFFLTNEELLRCTFKKRRPSTLLANLTFSKFLKPLDTPLTFFHTRVGSITTGTGKKFSTAGTSRTQLLNLLNELQSYIKKMPPVTTGAGEKSLAIQRAGVTATARQPLRLDAPPGEIVPQAQGLQPVVQPSDQTTSIASLPSLDSFNGLIALAVFVSLYAVASFVFSPLDFTTSAMMLGIGSVLLLIGGVICFFGYTLWEISIFGIGFFFGAGIIITITWADGSYIATCCLALITGIICGGVFQGLVKLAIFLVGAVIGGLFGSLLVGLLFSGDPDAALFGGFVLAIIGGIIALQVHKFVIVLSTSFSGGALISIGLMLPFVGPDFAELGVFFIVVTLAFGLFGMVIQYKYSETSEAGEVKVFLRPYGQRDDVTATARQPLRLDVPPSQIVPQAQGLQPVVQPIQESTESSPDSFLLRLNRWLHKVRGEPYGWRIYHMRCNNDNHEWTSRARNDGPPGSCPSCSSGNVYHTSYDGAENPNPGGKKYNCPCGDYSSDSKASYEAHKEDKGH